MHPNVARPDRRRFRGVGRRLVPTPFSNHVMRIEIEREDDGRWLAEIADLPGVLAYGDTPQTATARVKALALRVMADRLEHGEAIPELGEVFSTAA